MSGFIGDDLGGRWFAYTWATKPPASGWTGRTIRITDVGAATIGSLWSSDGTRWRPVNGHMLLAASAVAASCGADTTEDTLATITVPGAAMGLNAALRVSAFFSHTANVNAKTVRVRWGGAAGTVITAVSSSNITGYGIVSSIANRNASNSQVGWLQTYPSGAISSIVTANATASVDTTADTTLVITAQKAASGDTLTLEGYSLELAVP